MGMLKPRTGYGMAVGLCAALAACGGGGGDTAPAPAGQPPTPGVMTLSPSIAADTLAELNRLRQSAGFAPYSASQELTTAAASHASYLATNLPLGQITDGAIPHAEDPSKPGFTGATSSERARAAGYGTGVAEVVTTSGIASTSADVLLPIRALMNAPFHGLALLGGHVDAGVGVKANSEVVWTVIDFGAKAGAYRQIPAGDVRMWPCSGVTGILNRTVTREVPSPIEGRNTQTDPIGTPIYVLVPEGKRLTIASYDIRTEAGVVAPVAKVLGDAVTDGVAGNVRAIIPDKPLAPSATYTVTVTGTNDGTAFAKTCRFTTIG
jgi:uncharacterized protein YkwD